MAYWSEHQADAIDDEGWCAYREELSQKELSDPAFHPEWEVAPYPQSFSTSLDRFVEASHTLGFEWWYDRSLVDNDVMECGVRRFQHGSHRWNSGSRLAQGLQVKDIAQALAEACAEVLTREKGSE